MKLFGMLGATYTSWTQVISDPNLKLDWAKGWLGSLLGVLEIVMWITLALVGAAGSIYAIYVGIKMARADSPEAREENKKRLVNIMVSIIAVIVLIIFFNVFLPMILGSVWSADFTNVEQSSSIGTAVNTIRCLLRV